MTDTFLQFVWAVTNIVLLIFAYVVPKPIRFPQFFTDKVEKFIYASGTLNLIFFFTNVQWEM